MTQAAVCRTGTAVLHGLDLRLRALHDEALQRAARIWTIDVSVVRGFVAPRSKSATKLKIRFEADFPYDCWLGTTWRGQGVVSRSSMT